MATKSKLTRIEKRRRLEDLFLRGDYVRFGVDSNGRPVIDPEAESDNNMSIWVSPPSPLQREMAVREAQAARARTMVQARSDAQSPEWITIRGFISSLSNEQLIDYLVELDEMDYMSQARRSVLLEKKWENFNELRDAMRQFEESGASEDDEEWASLVARDKEFGDDVREKLTELRADARSGYGLMPRSNLEEKAVEKRIEQAGSAQFISLYEEWMVFYSCRDDEEHHILYFDNPDEIKALPDEVQAALSNKLSEFISDAGEAKN